MQKNQNFHVVLKISEISEKNLVTICCLLTGGSERLSNYPHITEISMPDHLSRIPRSFPMYYWPIVCVCVCVCVCLREKRHHGRCQCKGQEASREDSISAYWEDFTLKRNNTVSSTGPYSLSFTPQAHVCSCTYWAPVMYQALPTHYYIHPSKIPALKFSQPHGSQTSRCTSGLTG